MPTGTDVKPVETLTQSDVDAIVPKARNSRKGSGRRRFANTCSHRQAYVDEFEHITDEDFPQGYCPKFAHLPGDGRGPANSSILRTVRVIFTGLVKPLFYLALIYFAYTLLSGFLSGLPFGNFVPGPDFGVPANSVPAQDESIPPNSVDGASLPFSESSRYHYPVVIL